jgi:hypothetical protein
MVELTDTEKKILNYMFIANESSFMCRFGWKREHLFAIQKDFTLLTPEEFEIIRDWNEGEEWQWTIECYMD